MERKPNKHKILTNKKSILLKFNLMPCYFSNNT